MPRTDPAPLPSLAAEHPAPVWVEARFYCPRCGSRKRVLATIAAAIADGAADPAIAYSQALQEVANRGAADRPAWASEVSEEPVSTSPDYASCTHRWEYGGP